MSVARAVIQGRPTGDLQGGMVAELIAVAKRDLKRGDELEGAGGYAVYGLSERYEVARDQRLLPFGLAYGGWGEGGGEGGSATRLGGVAAGRCRFPDQLRGRAKQVYRLESV